MLRLIELGFSFFERIRKRSFLRIKTSAISKEDFYRSFLSGIKANSRFIEKTAVVPSLDILLERNSFAGDVNHEFFWIMRPYRIPLPFYQRIFQGKVIEKEECVEIEGRFCFPSHAIIWNIVLASIIAFMSFLFLFKFGIFSLAGKIVFSLMVGLLLYGITLGWERLISIACEKDVVHYLASRK